MATAFAVSGLASGIDSRTIIDSLIQADRAPARILEQKRSALQSRLDAVRTFNTRMLAVRDAADAVRGLGAFTAKSTTSSDSAIAVSAAAEAVATSYNLSVQGLARAHQVATAAADGKTSAGTAFATDGGITLRVGSGSAVNISVTDFSLNGIASAINAANAGVTASVVNDSATATPNYRLLVRASSTGTANQIQELTASGTLGANIFGGRDLAIDASTQVTAAANAKLRIGDAATGLLVERSSNTITDAIAGVTLTLTAEKNNVQVSVAQDRGGIKSKIKALVDAYNGAADYLKQNASYDAATKKAGPLLAEADLRRGLDDTLNRMLGNVGGQPAGFESLRALGVTTDANGRFTFDDALFTQKMNDNASAVEGTVRSVTGDIYTRLNALTDSTAGIIGAKASALETSITDINAQVVKIDARLEQRRKRYVAQFQAMEMSIQRIQSQSAQLSGALSGAASSSKKS